MLVAISLSSQHLRESCSVQLESLRAMVLNCVMYAVFQRHADKPRLPSAGSWEAISYQPESPVAPTLDLPVPSIVPLYLSSLPATAAPRSQPESIAILYALASGQSLPIPSNPFQDALPDLQAGLSYLFWKMFRC